MGAGGDAGQADHMPPAESSSRAGVLLAHRTIEFLRVQGAVLADGIFQEQIEHRPVRMAQFAVAMDDGAGAGLVAAADGFFRLPEKYVLFAGSDLIARFLAGIRLPVEEIASSVGAIRRHLPGAEDQAED